MPTIGYASLPIVPSLQGAKAKIESELSGAGREAGQRFGSDFSSAAQAALGTLKAAVQSAVLGITALGGAILVAGVNFNALEQKSRAALSTMLGGVQAANAQMDDLNRLVQTSPFGKDIFIQAQQQLIGFGRAAQKVVPDLKAINDAVAATGGGNQQLADISFVLAQISAAGKITGEDLIQLGQRGVNAAELIGSSMGKTGAEIKAEITKGSLDATTALDALTQGMEAKFGGASDAVKQTWDGVTQRISAQVRNMGSMLAEPFISPQGGGAAIVWANKLGDIMVAARKALQPIYDEIVNRLGPGFDRLSRFLDSIRAKLQGFDASSIGGLVDKMSQFAPVLAAGSAAMVAFSGHMLAGVPILGNLLGSINPVVAAVVAFTMASPELRDALGSALSQIASALAPVLPLVVDLVSTLANALVPVVKAVVDAVGPLAEIVAALLTPALLALQPVVEAVAWVLQKIADVVSVVLSPLSILAGALTGSGTAAGQAAQAWEKAQDNARGLLAGVGDLTTTLDKNSAAFTENTEKAIANYLAKHDLSNADVSKSGAPSVLTELQQWGVDTHAIVQGILGDADQLKIATDQINAAVMGTAQQDLDRSGLGATLKAAGVGARDLIDAANGVPEAVDKFQSAISAQFDASKGMQANQQLALQGNELLAKIKTDTAGYGEVLDYVGKQQKAATDAQKADIQAKIAAGDILGEVNGKLQVNAEQWGKIAPTLADAGETGEHLTARMADLGFVAADSTQAMIDAANAAIQLGAGGSQGAGGIDNMTSALQAFLQQAQQARAVVTNALTAFVDPADAWSETVQRVQDQAKDAASAAKRSATGPGSAQALADAAVKAGRKRADETKKSAKSEQDAAIAAAKAVRDAIVDRAKADDKAAKDAVTAAQKRVDAAKREADDLKRLSDQQTKDAKDAADALDLANDNLRAAQSARAAAAQGLAGAQSPQDRATWQRAYNEAVRSERDAKLAAGQAQSDYDAKAAAATATQKASEQASNDQAAAETSLASAKDKSAKASEDSAARQKAADDGYAKSKEQADTRYSKSVDAVNDTLQRLIDRQDAARESAKTMSDGTSGAMSAMAKNVQPSLQDYLQTLGKQVAAQQQWHDDIIELAKKLGPDIALELIEAGPKLATVVHQLTTATQPELDKFADLFPKSTAKGVQAATDELIAAVGGPLVEKGALLGQAQIDAMVTAMKTAKTPEDFLAIIQQFGVYMQNAADNNPITFRVKIDAIQAQNELAAMYGPSYNPTTYWGQGAHFANAGPVFGPGTGTSDSIPAWLSNGEHVWSDAEVKGVGGHAAVTMLRKMARDGALRLAGGGPASSQPAPQPPALNRGFTYYDYSTVYYPQTMPDSERTNRNLDHLAAFGSIG